MNKNMNPVIDTQHLCKCYGTVKALQDISLNIQQGELFGLIGPDGAGKTTLFRILTTLLNADSGEASVLGYDVQNEFRCIRREIGYMPGRFSLYQDLTVEENLNFFATIFQTTIEEHYDQIREIYEQIAPFRKRRAGALSGGMKQKLALCCALIHSPKILFLDEPTTGVDPVSRKEFWVMLKRLRDKGITILVSTPFMDEARKCDRIAFLYEGRIRGINTSSIILEQFKDILCPPGLKHNHIEENERPIIKVDNLVKCFGTFTAVDHISFEVKRGEIFGFLGANGAGKTTAMRILCGLSLPTEGYAKVMGYDVRTQSENIKRHIGYMSQRFSLYEDLTVSENVRLFGGIYGVPKKEIPARTEAMLRRIGLYEERNTVVQSLPLGWKQRLAFSVAIFHRPQLVFLDEPTGGVDPATRRQFWELIYQAAEQGITIFVTTHYMDEAEYCDRISMMVDGRIRALDTPTGLKAHFQAQNMDEVFQMLAREAKRNHN
jgi:ABC-type multidrug transport system ATPase subunit